MIIDRYDAARLSEAFGIRMSAVPAAPVGAGWGRVEPGGRSTPHQHDEIEVFVVVSGTGEIEADGRRHPVGPGTLVVFEPFETHVAINTGDTDLVFGDLYWRDSARATEAAAAVQRRRFDQRPLFVFSTPPTPNGDLHLGHLSGPYLGADAYVRFQRMNGATAWHLTGSDDFQSYVAAAARTVHGEPADTAAQYSKEIAETLRLMDIVPDQYTVPQDDADYAAGLRAFFSRLVDSGVVRPSTTAALFDGATGEYLYEVDVHGECPTCGAGTGGNLCEDCGEPNTAVDLVRPRSALSEATPREGELCRFCLPLHRFGPFVAEHHRLGRVPARLRELAGRVFGRDRFDVPLTHLARWGVEPTEPAVSGQVIWAWPEMSYGFLHGIEALGRRIGVSWRADAPERDWKIVHFFGYDNSFYHAVLYPTLYRLAFPDWEPDIDYHVNEFYLLEDAKFSTSRRHAVWGKEVLGPDTVDALRFYLSLTRPEGRRTAFSRAHYASVVRNTLIGGWQEWLRDLGERVRDGYRGVAPDAGVWTPEHTAFLRQLGTRLAAVTSSLSADGFSLNRAAEELDGLVTDARRFAERERSAAGLDPWRDEARTAVALELAAARLLAACAMPVMPRFAGRLAAALGQPTPVRWPHRVDLVPPGARVDLARPTFFVPQEVAGE
ncbi:class I tRNA ligase family protein [Kutzneria kofuensis]|uniref:Methionyl-tRNA synthetase n=1 Tax=Kutzneria kofuensis TaxID=103725 RepID=A0A7W9KPA9_9PSEU|nr:class I tRNA ligase family protein [Kutzneria kofuensis]MBB5896250.1 methionyl-tRNA synthetase [Kutzneria kofuensis]